MEIENATSARSSLMRAPPSPGPINPNNTYPKEHNACCYYYLASDDDSSHKSKDAWGDFFGSDEMRCDLVTPINKKEAERYNTRKIKEATQKTKYSIERNTSWTGISTG